MNSLLEVDGLRVEIKMRESTVSAVDGVSLVVRPGETLGIVGESGSGKTMTAMAIMGLLPPGGHVTGGSIKVSGQEVTTLSEAKLRRIRGSEVGMVFQDPMTSLNPMMTIGAQIARPVRRHWGVSSSAAMERAAEVLSLVGMPKPGERLKSYPHELSGGLRQRAMIAMALACSPKLLIADEPTTALDVTIQDQILSLLDDLKAKLDMGMLLITHDMGVIAGRADRVLVMYAGRVVETGDIATIFRKMRHPYTQALLESMPDLTTDRSSNLYSIPGMPPDLSHPPTCCRFADRCRYVRDRCRSEDPELSGEAGGHQFACFFPVEGVREPVQPTGTGSGAAVGAAPSPVSEGSPAPQPASNPKPTLLTLENVVKEFPIVKGVLRRKVGSVKAVSGVSLSIAAGETFGLVGESGCGKTTLGRLIVGLDTADSGDILFDGGGGYPLRGAALRQRRRDVQLMFQDPYASLDPRMRVTSILREPLDAQRVGDRKQRDKRVRQLLDDVGLAARALQLYPHEFSGGQRQRIGLARALAIEPRLVVADEPVSALDVSVQSQILNLMKRIQAERDLTYIIISHDLSVVRYLSDRVGVMYLGKMVEIGPVIDVYDHTAHPYTAGLLAAIPTPVPGRRHKKEASVRGELPSAANPPSGCRFRTRCPLAQEICAEEEPPLRPFGVLGHQAACHFPLQTPLPASALSGTGAGAGSAEGDAGT